MLSTVHLLFSLNLVTTGWRNAPTSLLQYSGGLLLYAGGNKPSDCHSRTIEERRKRGIPKRDYAGQQQSTGTRDSCPLQRYTMHVHIINKNIGVALAGWLWLYSKIFATADQHGLRVDFKVEVGSGDYYYGRNVF